MSEYIVDLSINKDFDVDDIKELAIHIKRSHRIVRCRDCKRFHPKEGTMFACKFEYGEFTQWRSAEPNGFCSWGELNG